MSEQYKLNFVVMGLLDRETHKIVKRWVEVGGDIPHQYIAREACRNFSRYERMFYAPILRSMGTIYVDENAKRINIWLKRYSDNKEEEKESKRILIRYLKSLYHPTYEIILK